MTTEADRATSSGQVLAGRYRLERLLTGTGRPARLWRGVDIVLNRPVAVKVIDSDHPGAAALLTAAVGSGRVSHRVLTSVFDADRQGSCTYVVSEWVDGQPLHRLLVNEEVLAPTRAAYLAGAAADAVAAAHAAGVTHGNLHPANLLVAADGEVRLTDLSGAGDDRTDDLRQLGALLYAGLTGRWAGRPEEADGLPAAPRHDGRPVSPSQVRAGVPSSLSALTMRALTARDDNLTAAGLAAELARHGDDPSTGQLPTIEAYDDPPERTRGPWVRIGVPVLALLLIAVIGLVIGIRIGAISPPPGLNYPSYTGGKNNSSPTPSPPSTLISPASARILDPQGDGTELAGAGRAIDGSISTGWQTQDYASAAFGRLKRGMGVIVDLGRSTTVGSVTVTFGRPGATVELRSADSSGSTADAFAVRARQTDGGSTVRFTPSGSAAARYWLVWITTLPANASGAYSADVREIAFRR